MPIVYVPGAVETATAGGADELPLSPPPPPHPATNPDASTAARPQNNQAARVLFRGRRRPARTPKPINHARLLEPLRREEFGKAAVAPPPVVIVSVVVAAPPAVGVTAAGLNEQAALAGKLAQLKLTGWLNPAPNDIDTVVVALWPVATVPLLAPNATVKSEADGVLPAGLALVDTLVRLMVETMPPLNVAAKMSGLLSAFKSAATRYFALAAMPSPDLT